jgi:hypothetical protein
MNAKVLILEFNEISPALLGQWRANGRLPNFKRFYDESDVFVTVADDPDPVNLEPWIQWYSVHTGLPYSEHRVFHLTDGPRAPHGDLWQLIRQGGRSVMNFSSMNARGFKGKGAFFLPDPWCAAQEAWPPEIGIFAKVVSTAVQEYTNTRIPLTYRDYLAFVKFLASHGLSPSTAAMAFRQLVAEKLVSRDLSWRRVAVLDRLLYDVFAHYYNRMRPDFATFFSNSTAHLQHAYWRHMDPEPFTVKPSVREMQAYGDAVYFGYEAMDRLIARFLRLVDSETVVILCSALSQQPFLRREQAGGQHFYRLHDVVQFLASLDLQTQKVEPVMTHQYVALFASDKEAAVARDRLRGIRIQGAEVFGVTEPANSSLKFGCQIATPISGDEALTGVTASMHPVRFKDLLYPLGLVKSGCHHPEGLLWIRNGRHYVHPERVSILDIAPTVCRILKLDPALVGRAAFRGADLVDRLALAA